MQVSLHRQAIADMQNAIQHYEEKRNGLGDEFLDEVEAARRAIALSPRQQAVVRGTIRQYLVDRFPYSILYRVNAQRVRILAVRHHSQHPDYGLKRR